MRLNGRIKRLERQSTAINPPMLFINFHDASEYWHNGKVYSQAEYDELAASHEITLIKVVYEDNWRE